MITYCPRCESHITPRRDGICPTCREYRPQSEWSLIAEPDARSAEERYEQVLGWHKEINRRWAVRAVLCLLALLVVGILLYALWPWLAFLSIPLGLAVAFIWVLGKGFEGEALIKTVHSDGELGIWAARDGIISIKSGYLDASSTYHRRAEFQLDHGMDPRTNLDKAAEMIAKLLEIEPQLSPPNYNLGSVERDRGCYERMVGRDPETAWLGAVESFRMALKDDPDDSTSMLQLAWVLADLASWELEHGRDPAPRIEESRRLFLRVQELHHSRTTVTRDESGAVASLHFGKGASSMAFNETPPRGLARLALLEADRERSVGSNPNNALTEAERILSEALEGNSSDAEFWRDEGEAGLWKEKAEFHRRRAAVAGGQGRAAAAELDEALVALRRCRKWAASAETMAVDGALRMQKSKLTGEGADEARELLEEALAINSNLVHDFGQWLEP